jgi:sulfur-carrier protein
MKIKIELFGAARDFSEKDYLELTIPDNITIKEVRNNLMNYIQNKYPDNSNYLEIVKNSAFANDHDVIVQDNYKLSTEKKLCIIPPVGGG